MWNRDIFFIFAEEKVSKCGHLLRDWTVSYHGPDESEYTCWQVLSPPCCEKVSACRSWECNYGWSETQKSFFIRLVWYLMERLADCVTLANRLSLIYITSYSSCCVFRLGMWLRWNTNHVMFTFRFFHSVLSLVLSLFLCLLFRLNSYP